MNRPVRAAFLDFVADAIENGAGVLSASLRSDGAVLDGDTVNDALEAARSLDDVLLLAASRNGRAAGGFADRNNECAIVS